MLWKLITMQMQNTQYSDWMAKPQGIPGCPPGLEYLTQIDQMLVRQKKDCMEIFTGWEQRNRFEIRNALNQMVSLSLFVTKAAFGSK